MCPPGVTNIAQNSTTKTNKTIRTIYLDTFHNGMTRLFAAVLLLTTAAAAAATSLSAAGVGRIGIGSTIGLLRIGTRLEFGNHRRNIGKHLVLGLQLRIVANVLDIALVVSVLLIQLAIVDFVRIGRHLEIGTGVEHIEDLLPFRLRHAFLLAQASPSFDGQIPVDILRVDSSPLLGRRHDVGAETRKPKTPKT